MRITLYGGCPFLIKILRTIIHSFRCKNRIKSEEETIQPKPIWWQLSIHLLLALKKKHPPEIGQAISPSDHTLPVVKLPKWHWNSGHVIPYWQRRFQLCILNLILSLKIELYFTLNSVKWNFTPFSKSTGCILIDTPQPLSQPQIMKDHLHVLLYFFTHNIFLICCILNKVNYGSLYPPWNKKIIKSVHLTISFFTELRKKSKLWN